MGALRGGGGLRADPQLVPGLGGVAVILSFTPKFHDTGDPGLDSTPGDTSSTMS